MGRLYKGILKVSAQTAQIDFAELQAPTDAIVYVHEWEIGQSTEVGDAQEEELVITENRGVGTVTSGSGGTTVTPQPVEDGDPAFGGTLEMANTTKMVVGTGTLEETDAYVWNIRQAYLKVYTPETRPVISPGNRWTLELETTPADSISFTFRVVFEEVGG